MSPDDEFRLKIVASERQLCSTGRRFKRCIAAVGHRRAPAAALTPAAHPGVMLPIIAYNLVQQLVAGAVDFAFFRRR